MPKLNDEDQLVPTKENLAIILAEYGIADFRFDLATSGIENLTVLVHADRGEYVLRVYRQNKKIRSDVELELRFVQYLREHGIPVPDIVHNGSGEALAEVRISDRPWLCLLMEFSAGEHPEKYSSALLGEMARIQATCHILGASYAQGAMFSGDLKDLACYASPVPHKEAYAHGDVQAFLDRANAYSLPGMGRLPSGYVHLDFDSGNILARDNEITAVLDFDDLSLAPLTACLGNTLWHIYVETGDLAVVRGHVRSYEAVRALTDAERAALPGIMLLRHYCIGLLSATVWRLPEEKMLELVAQEAEIRTFRFLPA